MNSQTEENYLKTLYHIEAKNEEVTITDLSRRLKVSMPSVNSMVKRLHLKKLLVYRKYRPLVLTESGRKAALAIIRKHRLVEMFLVEKMGFGWEEVHEIAEQMEHIQSPLFFDRIDKLLGYPEADPHGSPIPNKFGEMRETSHRTLDTFSAGDKVRLVAIANSSREFLDYLNSKKISLQTTLQIERIEAFDKSMEVCYVEEGRRDMISQQVAQGLYAEKI
mgnify:CR=1 FL=1